MTGNSARFATPSAAVITTKSGTNAIHGSLFETARNNAIGLAKPRGSAGYIPPHLVRNEFGASAGGPIVIPHLYNGKNKSFWFLGFEELRQGSFTTELVTVLTPAMRVGDFSGLKNSAGVLQQLYDPATTAASTNCNGSGTANPYCRAPFAKNQIPISRLSPMAKIIYDITPLPTTADNPLVAPNLTAINPSDNVVPNITFRLYHNFDANNKVYVRYTTHWRTPFSLRNQPANEPATVAADGLPNNASGIAYSPLQNEAAAIGYTKTFSPTFFSESVVSAEWFTA